MGPDFSKASSRSGGKSLNDLPYDILLQICEELDHMRSPAYPPKELTNPDATITTTTQAASSRTPGGYTFKPRDELSPPKRHDSPRRAEAYRIATDNYKTGARLGTKPYECVSIFDGLSRTNKYLRDITYPYLFKNVVLACDDCLTLDRLVFYSGATWMLQHVRSFRFFSTYMTWPDSIGSNLPPQFKESAVTLTYKLMTSIPYLETLHFMAEPDYLREGLRTAFTKKRPADLPLPFPYVKDLYIKVHSEWLIPLCGSEAGLEVFEYEAPYNIKSADKVSLTKYGAINGPFGGIPDPRAVALLSGLQQLKLNRLRKVTIAAFIDLDGLRECAPFFQNVEELHLLYGYPMTYSRTEHRFSPATAFQDIARALDSFPNLRKIRFERDEELRNAGRSTCYMSGGDLLRVCNSSSTVEEVWHKDRYMAHVKRRSDGQADMDETRWVDTWAPKTPSIFETFY